MNNRLILVVDDEPQICAELCGYLSQKGYQTVLAKDGSDAFSIFLAQKPVCVLTDYKMPKMDGLELLKKIKQVNSDVHVILISGAADVKVVAESMKNDAFDFLAKPVDLKSLIELVHIAVERTINASKARVDGHLSSFVYHKEMEGRKDVSIVFFNKDLDEMKRDKYNHYIHSLMSEHMLRKYVIFNLGNARYINNIGLKFLIENKEMLDKEGKQLFLCSLAEQVEKYINLLGYNTFFKIERNMAGVLEQIVADD